MINAYTVGRFFSWFGAPTSRLSSITRKRASLLGMFTALRQSRVSGNSPLQELRGNQNHFIFHNLWLKTKLFFIEYIHMYMQHHLWNVFYFSFALLKKCLNLETKYIHLDVCLFRYSKKNFRYNFALFLKLKTVFHFKQQCISIVSNTHAVTDLSNMHHYTYSTTTKLMTSASSTKLLTSAQTNLPTSASPTKSQTPTPGHTTNIPTSVHTSALPTSVSTLSTTAALMGIPVVGRRQERQKRYTSCEHCCRGDLCNNACVHHSEFLFVTSILQKTFRNFNLHFLHNLEMCAIPTYTYNSSY